MEEREKSTFLFLVELNRWKRRERAVGEEGEKYKYPLPSNGLGVALPQQASQQV